MATNKANSGGTFDGLSDIIDLPELRDDDEPIRYFDLESEKMKKSSGKPPPPPPQPLPLPPLLALPVARAPLIRRQRGRPRKIEGGDRVVRRGQIN
ncbi:hypothetical protein QJS10_CPB13g00063 [Acorus calamus]|uniref:Uncharacterized protein n=1 Tax=Acorus calamus TaxID=4465 RepID=A0AAV9DGS6_ACOCL|nr:hypothetical protein QJS10_CPB13g00063 [Acorus calamus]